MAKEMLSTEQATDFLNVSIRTLLRMREEYPIIFTKKEGRNFYTKASLAKAKKLRDQKN